MGRAYVQAFAARGAQVVGLDHSWSAAPPEILALSCDVTNPNDLAAAYRATVERFGRLDVLINNAALRQRDLFPPHGAVLSR
jgi:NAD(P)-dependent dehydrogenase (short-subunit alcohol dehydrogenase family)